MNTQFLNSLKPLPKDERDFKLGAIITLPKVSELPPSYVIEIKTIKEQIDDFCSANACTLLLEQTEGEELDELWYFAASKKLSGDVDEFGQDLRTAAKTAVKMGAVAQKDAPFSKDKGSAFLRRYENYPNLEDKALIHKQKTYFWVTGPNDQCDNLRCSLWAFRHLKRGAAMGLLWGWPLSQTILDGTPQGYGHAVAAIGFERMNGEDYIIIANSYGTQAGNNGRHYVSRETFNTYAEMFGVAMFIDLSREEADYYLSRNIKITDNWIIQLWKAFLGLFKRAKNMV